LPESSTLADTSNGMALCFMRQYSPVVNIPNKAIAITVKMNLVYLSISSLPLHACTCCPGQCRVVKLYQAKLAHDYTSASAFANSSRVSAGSASSFLTSPVTSSSACRSAACWPRARILSPSAFGRTWVYICVVATKEWLASRSTFNVQR